MRLREAVSPWVPDGQDAPSAWCALQVGMLGRCPGRLGEQEALSVCGDTLGREVPDMARARTQVEGARGVCSRVSPEGAIGRRNLALDFRGLISSGAPGGNFPG